MQRDASAKSIKRGVEASLKALAKDYIDLYQVHWPDPNSPFEETATALHEAVEAGKIRHVGSPAACADGRWQQNTSVQLGHGDPA